MASFNKKTVAFEECITIRYYEYDRDEEYVEKRGIDWQRTSDLTCREFKLPLENGGCGGDWNILQSKLDELEEPYWYLIGQLWNRLFPGVKRLEENDDDNDSDDNDSDVSDSGYDEINDGGNQIVYKNCLLL